MRTTVGISDTGGGFKKFAAGETDVSNTSRPIRETEGELARKNGVDYLELKVAVDTILDGSDSPLSRPIFIYVNRKSLQRPEVLEFVKFYLTQAPKLVPQVGYTPLPQADYDTGLEAVEAAQNPAP